MLIPGFSNFRFSGLLLLAALCLFSPVEASASPCDTGKVFKLLRQEKYVVALETLQPCGEDLHAAKARGIAFHGLFKADSSLANLKRAFDGGLRDDAVLVRLAETFLWKKDFRNAGIIMDQVKDKLAPAYLKVLGRKHEILGEFPEAIKLYDQVMAKEKLPYGTMERKAIVLSWMKEYDRSIEQFEAIIRDKAPSRPLKIRCLIRKAEVLSWKAQFDPGLAQLDKALAMDPKNVDARLVKGRILEWKGEYKPAQAVYREILGLEPANDQAKLRLEKLSWAE